MRSVTGLARQPVAAMFRTDYKKNCGLAGPELDFRN
jgi:hypothetical protein